MNDDYTEILIPNGAEVNRLALGVEIVEELNKGKAVVIRVVNDPTTAKPWAANNEGNVNRRGRGQ